MTRKVVSILLGTLALPWSALNVSFAAPLNRVDFSAAAVDIDFEGFPTHTQISTQYQSQGVVFTTAGSSPQANNDNAASYGPLAAGNILATGSSLGSSTIEMSFIDPVSNLPAATSGVGADIIFRDTLSTATLEVFDAAMMSLGSVTTAPDAGPVDEVFLGFGAPGIYKAVFTFAVNDSFAGIDNLIFEPVPEPTALILCVAAFFSLSMCRRNRWTANGDWA